MTEEKLSTVEMHMLREVPFFSQLSNDQIQSLIDKGEILRVDADTVIFNEEDSSHSMYIVLTGCVKISKRDEDGDEIILSRLEEGEFFGEFALLDNRPRSAAATCTFPTELLKISQEGFQEFIESADSNVIFQILTALSYRMRNLSESYFQEELSKKVLQTEMEIARHRSLSQMVAGIAHEINTPLGIANTAASIINNALNSSVWGELAQSHNEARAQMEDMLEALDLLMRNIQRAHMLTQEFKKISVSQLTDHKQSLNIVDGVSSSIELFSINARQAKLTIDIHDELGDHSPLWQGYYGHLSTVLLNLLTNIERYAYPERQGGHIDIYISNTDEHVPPYFEIRVQDYGAGILEENISEVFTPFFTTGRSRGGTGLGMAIVYSIVTEALQGKIVINSTPQEGTTVTICVPQIIE